MGVVNAGSKPVRFDGDSTILGMPFCFPHFKRLKPDHFLRAPKVRAQIEGEFRKRNAIPWWTQATVNYVRKGQPEFQQFIDAVIQIRRIQNS
jgi:hypothetical protein